MSPTCQLPWITVIHDLRDGTSGLRLDVRHRSRLCIFNRRQLAPKNVVRVGCFPAQAGYQLGDLSAMVPGVAENLGQHSFDVPPISSTVGQLIFEHAGQFRIIEPSQVGDPGRLCIYNELRQIG